MSSMHLVFSSDRMARSHRPRRNSPPSAEPAARRLSSLEEGEHGIVVEVGPDGQGRADRLLALGVPPGARVTMLQRFPGVVFLCDQTELAVERTVADAIHVREEKRS
jgi:Fe2+ transport system protein FeoA